MDIIALKTDRGQVYSIQQFVIMSEIERESFKGQLMCEECGGEAHYRKSSKDGKSACFVATHILPCDNASNNKSSKDDSDEETNEVKLSQEFEIVWNYKRNPIAPLLDREAESNPNIKNNQKRYVSKPIIETKGRISLSSILRFAEYDILKNQTYDVNIPEVGLKQLKDIVVNLEDVNDKHLNKNLFLWGNINNFKGRWLNTSYQNDIGIIVEESIQKRFWDLYKKKLYELIRNKKCLIIVFGKVWKTKEGKFLIKLGNIKYSYVRGSRR